MKFWAFENDKINSQLDEMKKWLYIVSAFRSFKEAKNF